MESNLCARCIVAGRFMSATVPAASTTTENVILKVQ